MLDTPSMLVELSVMEQWYQAVSFVIHDGEVTHATPLRPDWCLRMCHLYVVLEALSDESSRGSR